MSGLRIIVIMALVFETSSAVLAQSYPSRSIRVITANSAGGTSDVFLRALAAEFQTRTGQALIVENRSGGGMNIAGKACADAPNDGYTICMLPNETLTLNQFVYKSISYEPEKDFVPITNCFIDTQVMVVSAKLNVHSLDELAALSKRQPGTLSYSALAIPMQITLENWKKHTGADIVSVPARGGGDIVNGLLTGTVPVAIVGLPNFIEYIRSAAVTALAVDSENRSPLFPDVPTLSELGFPNLAPAYFAFVAPRGTPSDVVDIFYQHVSTIGNDPDFQKKRLLDLGLVPIFDSPAEFQMELERQRENSRKLITESRFERR
jgi:tripartite-type tricarboxylate transporter receptor subunit TctC